MCVQFNIVRVMFEQRLISLSLSLYILFVCFVLLRSLLTDRSLAPFILFILLSYPILYYTIQWVLYYRSIGRSVDLTRNLWSYRVHVYVFMHSLVVITIIIDFSSFIRFLVDVLLGKRVVIVIFVFGLERYILRDKERKF